MANTTNNSENTDAQIVVMEQPTLGEQALAAAVIAGATIAGSFVVYGIGAGLVYVGGKLHEANERRKNRKFVKRAQKAAEDQES